MMAMSEQIVKSKKNLSTYCELEHVDEDLRVNRLSTQRRKYQFTISCELEHANDDLRVNRLSSQRKC